MTLKGGVDRTVYQELDLHRRRDREQRRPQLQPLRRRAARQLRAHARRQAVRRDRRRSARARSRDRPHRRAPRFRRPLRQSRHHLRVLAHRSPATSRSAMLARNYKDPTLPDISGLTFDASLTWLASALTTVKLTARTTVDESIAGRRLRRASRARSRCEVDHAFRRWLIATLEVHRRDSTTMSARRALDERYATVGAHHLQAHARAVAQGRVPPRMAPLQRSPATTIRRDVVLLGVRLQR